jgi:hypothetical protein
MVRLLSRQRDQASSFVGKAANGVVFFATLVFKFFAMFVLLFATQKFVRFLYYNETPTQQDDECSGIDFFVVVVTFVLKRKSIFTFYRFFFFQNKNQNSQLVLGFCWGLFSNLLLVLLFILQHTLMATPGEFENSFF